MKYILGIDTTFHSSCVGLIDEKGNVLENKKSDIEFDDQNAKKFFNFHNRSMLALTKPILDKYGKNIFLISVSCEYGPFHSMPVGAIIANSISYFSDKKIVGTNHDISHMHANWLDRDEKDFSFPIVSLNVSGAHSDIYLIKNLAEVERIAKIVWRDDPEKFGGLGALFDVICYSLNIRIKKGEGGLCFENLARLGKPNFRKFFENIKIRKENGNFHFCGMESNISEALENLGYHYLKGEASEKFQRDFTASLSEIIFDSLVEAMAQVARETGAREIHLAGGVALDKMLNSKLAAFCEKNNYDYKIPLKPEYCRDNAAMAAISGYFKWKYSDEGKDNKFLNIKPSEWYFKFYTKYFDKYPK